MTPGMFLSQAELVELTDTSVRTLQLQQEEATMKCLLALAD